MAMVAVAIIALAGLVFPLKDVVNFGVSCLSDAVTCFTAVDTEDGYSVDGTTVIDGSGNYDGAVTASSLTYLESVTSLTGSTTLTTADSGKTIYWNTSGGTTTLPAVSTATGTIIRFVVGSALTGTYNAQISSAEGDNIEGSLIVAGAVVDCNAVDRIYVLTDGENLGDFVELRSNGQNWYVTQSNALTSGKLLCDG